MSVTCATLAQASCTPAVGPAQTESGSSDAMEVGTDPSIATSSTSSITDDGSSASDTTTSGVASGSSTGEEDSSSGDPPVAIPNQAANMACAALRTAEAVDLPGPFGTGFPVPEYPARFQLDITQAESFVEGNTWCHFLTSGCVDCPHPLGDSRQWQDDDGEYRVVMVTRGIDHIDYYGTDEPIGGEMFAPLVPSAQYDVSQECPELPVAWTPDPAQGPYVSAPVICMHHSEDIAEVVFVRVPE